MPMHFSYPKYFDQVLVVLNSQPPNLYGLRKDHKESKSKKNESEESKEEFEETMIPANCLEN